MISSSSRPKNNNLIEEQRQKEAGACADLPASGPSSQAYPTKVLTYTLTTSKVAYFKRKYAEEEDLHQDYHEYFPKHLILPEDRTCILKLSLEKLRFLEDPETYLRS
ncbi:SERTA domain-containing protein 4 [Manis javanica]|nr:SERTA domain-containing protein 4 [Manis javanica]